MQMVTICMRFECFGFNVTEHDDVQHSGLAMGLPLSPADNPVRHHVWKR